jgi:hypothetical protein
MLASAPDSNCPETMDMWNQMKQLELEEFYDFYQYQVTIFRRATYQSRNCKAIDGTKANCEGTFGCWFDFPTFRVACNK